LTRKDDIDCLAVHRDVPVQNELAGLGAAHAIPSR
jgi:hypothetical protein